MIDWTGPEKIMFASDAPLPTYYLPTKEWVNVFRNPKTDIEFSEREIEWILGKSAEAVFLNR